MLEYGEELGLGSREYELVDVLPVEEFAAPRSVTCPPNPEVDRRICMQTGPNRARPQADRITRTRALPGRT